MSTVVTIMTSYCPPAVTNCGANDIVHDFAVIGDLNTQINDSATGCALNSYDNRTSSSITLFTGRNDSIQTSSLCPSGQYFSVWIDFNRNLMFELSERVANVLLNGTGINTVTLSIPTVLAGATTGVHRMRASVAYNVAPNPCEVSLSFGETHDYTAHILPRKRSCHAQYRWPIHTLFLYYSYDFVLGNICYWRHTYIPVFGLE